MQINNKESKCQLKDVRFRINRKLKLIGKASDGGQQIFTDSQDIREFEVKCAVAVKEPNIIDKTF
jgi:hypothetical protein